MLALGVGLACVAHAARGPVIEHVEPSQVSAGETLSLVGRGFDGELEARLGEARLEVLERSPTRLRLRVPTAARSGRVRIASDGAWVTGPFVRITQAETALRVRRMTPRSGPPGTRVRLRGEGFAAYAADNRVTLGGHHVMVQGASPRHLDVVVPEGVRSARFVVRVEGHPGRARSPEPFEVSRGVRIEDVEPTSGPAGSEVRIFGSGFAYRPWANQVRLGDVEARVVKASEGELRVRVPDDAEGGHFEVRVSKAGRARSQELFQVRREPPTAPEATNEPRIPLEITGFEPRSAPPGSVLTVAGRGFGGSPRAHRVRIGGEPAKVLEVEAHALRVRVPEDASTGPIRVEIESSAQRARTQRPFIVCHPPRLARFEPKQVALGERVVIHGSGFGDSPALLRVRVGDEPLEVLEARDDRIVARVSAGVETGTLQVAVRLEGAAAFEEPLRVLPDPVVTRMDPLRARRGQIITLHGVGLEAKRVRVAFSGATATPLESGPERIRVRVPAEARSGLVVVRLGEGREAPAPRDLEIMGRQAPPEQPGGS